jgi:hypothetical protein
MPALAGGNSAGQQIELRALAAAIDAFDGDEPAESASIDLWTQIRLNSRVTWKAHHSIFSLTALSRRCNATHVTMRDSSGTRR